MTWGDCVWWWITEHATVLAAVISALAAVAVAVFTYTLKKATVEQAELTRKGIELAASEFAASHRPRMAVLLIRPFTAILNQIEPGSVPMVEITFVNTGATTARITEINAAIFDKESVTKGPTLKNPHLFTPSVETGGQIGFNIPFDPSHTFLVSKPRDRVGALPYGGADLPPPELYCIGYIRYGYTARAGEYETSFCRLLDNATGRWLRVENSEYEYAY